MRLGGGSGWYLRVCPRVCPALAENHQNANPFAQNVGLLKMTRASSKNPDPRAGHSRHLTLLSESLSGACWKCENVVQNEQQHLLLSWGGALQLSLMAPKIRFFSDPARMAAKQKEEEEEKQKKEQEAKKVPEAKKVKELSGSAKAVKELRHA